MADRTVRLSELAQKNWITVGAGRPRSAVLDGYSLPILRVADVLDGTIAATLRGAEDIPEERLSNPKISRPGDVVLTVKGTVGRVAIMPAKGAHFAYSPQLCYFRPSNDGPLIARYLYYWFKSAEFWKQANALKGQTDMADYISLSDILSLKISLPNISEQQAIAEVLGALDDKIAANNRILTIVDDLIRAMYTKLPESTMTIGDIATQVRSQVSPDELQAGTKYLGLEHLPRRNIWATERGDAKDVSSAKSEFIRGDVLFGKLRPYFHKVISAGFSGICSTDIIVLRAKESRLAGLVLAAASSDDAVRACTAASEGTRMPRTSWKDLAAVPIRCPDADSAEEFSASVVEKSEYAHALVEELATLARTRDELLPLLMSGKLRVKDAEKKVEAIA